VLKLAEHFQSQLDAAQRSHWLELEEALLEHVARLHRSYFREGITKGFRKGVVVQLRGDVVVRADAALAVVTNAVAGRGGAGSAGSGVASVGGDVASVGGDVAVRQRRRARRRRAGAGGGLPAALEELEILVRKLQEVLSLLRALAEQVGDRAV
jgi:hypothetical protein